MKRLNLNVFIDALGWKLCERNGFLNQLCTHRQPVRTVLGYSSTCDPTILTGALPRDHGHFTFFRLDPDASPFKRWEYRLLSALPNALTGRGRVRNRISQWMKPRHAFTGYFSLYAMPFDRIREFDYTERRDLYEPGGIIGGQRTIFDRFRAAGIEWTVSDWRNSDDENLADMAEVLRKGSASSAYLYLAGLDGILHRYGTDHAKVAEKLAGLEAALTELVEGAYEHYDEVVVRVFSDHGMTNVRSTCDVEQRLLDEGLVWGRDYRAAFDSTMARFWFDTPDAEARAIAILTSLDLPGRILSEEELKKEGCDFPRRSYGHQIFLMDPGVLIVPSDMGQRPIAGMHGFHPDHEDSTATLLSNAPVSGVTSLTDLHEMMWIDATDARRAAA